MLLLNSAKLGELARIEEGSGRMGSSWKFLQMILINFKHNFQFIDQNPASQLATDQVSIAFALDVRSGVKNHLFFPL